MVFDTAALSHPDVEHLVELASRDDLGLLSLAASSQEAMVRLAGIKALRHIGGRGAITGVTEALKYDGFFNHPASDALAVLVNADAVAELIELLASDDPDTRRFAFDAIGEQGDVRAVEPLLRKLGPRGLFRRDPALDVLARLHARD